MKKYCVKSFKSCFFVILHFISFTKLCCVAGIHSLFHKTIKENKHSNTGRVIWGRAARSRPWTRSNTRESRSVSAPGPRCRPCCPPEPPCATPGAGSCPPPSGWRSSHTRAHSHTPYRSPARHTPGRGRGEARAGSWTQEHKHTLAHVSGILNTRTH